MDFHENARLSPYGRADPVRPFPLALPVSYAYWIVCPKAASKLPKIATFREWLLAEADSDARRLEDMAPTS